MIRYKLHIRGGRSSMDEGWCESDTERLWDRVSVHQQQPSSHLSNLWNQITIAILIKTNTRLYVYTVTLLRIWELRLRKEWLEIKLRLPVHTTFTSISFKTDLNRYHVLYGLVIGLFFWFWFWFYIEILWASKNSRWTFHREPDWCTVNQ